MKSFHQHEVICNSSYKSVPVVRLDSGAVRIPVELIDNIILTGTKKRVLRITVYNSALCAWR